MIGCVEEGSCLCTAGKPAGGSPAGKDILAGLSPVQRRPMQDRQGRQTVIGIFNIGSRPGEETESAITILTSLQPVTYLYEAPLRILCKRKDIKIDILAGAVGKMEIDDLESFLKMSG